MQRQSARKVKLTSKFEEFSTARLASIQRIAHPEAQQAALSKVEPPTQPNNDFTPQKPEPRVGRPRIDREAQNQSESKSQDVSASYTPRERISHKALRAKAAAAAASAPPKQLPSHPPTPSGEQSVTPVPYSGQSTPLPKLTANGKVRGRPRKIWQQQKAETVVKPMSSTREELLRLREENANLKAQLEQRNNEFEELQRNSSYTGQTVPKSDYDDLKEKYQRDISHAKRNEWCVVCLNPSRYPCCWNTTYCSQKCQLDDWYAQHGKHCERRRRELGLTE